MVSVNQKILDELISHDVDITGYEQELVEIVNDLIDKHGDKAINSIYSAISGKDPSEVTFSEIDKIISSTNNIGKLLTAALFKSIGKQLYGFLDNEIDYSMQLLYQTIPIKVDLRKPSPRLINQIITRNPMQGRLLEEYFRGAGDAFSKVFAQELRQGLFEGKTADEIVKVLAGTKAGKYKDGKLEIRKKAAKAFLRTALSHISNNAADAVYQENSDIIKKLKFAAVLDTKTTNFCKRHDNLVYSIDDKKRPKLPAHFSCRSRYIPVTKSWRELGFDIDELDDGTRASMDGQVPQDTSYNDWLKRQSAERVVQALGVTRAKLFKDGGLSIKGLINARGETLTLDQLRSKRPQAFKNAGL